MKKVLVVTLLALALSTGLSSAEELTPQEWDRLMKLCLVLVGGAKEQDVKDFYWVMVAFDEWSAKRDFKAGQFALAFNRFMRECKAQPDARVIQALQALGYSRGK